MIPDNMNTVSGTGCVIMASGLGTRFGGNKLLADFHGTPMFLQIVEATEGLFEKRVVVTRHEEVASICRKCGIDVVLHDLPHRNDTVRLGLKALGNVDACLFCPGDQPLLRRETVADMLQFWQENRDSIIRPVCDGNPGAPVLFPAWTFPELMVLPEGKGGNWVAGKHPEQVKLLPVADPYELMDADTTETLEILRQRAAVCRQ